MVVSKMNDNEMISLLKEGKTNKQITCSDIQRLAEEQLIALDYKDAHIMKQLEKALKIRQGSKNIIEMRDAAERLYIAVYEEDLPENILLSPTYGVHSGHHLMNDYRKIGIQSMIDMNEALLNVVRIAAENSKDQLEAKIGELAGRSYTTINIDSKAMNITIL